MSPIERTGCLDESLALRFYQDATTEQESEYVREHIVGCSECRELAQDAQAFAAAMRDLRVTQPVDTARRFGTRWLWVAAAVVIIAVCMTPYVGRRSSLVITPAPYEMAEDDNADVTWRSGGKSREAFDAGMRAYLAADYAAAELALEAQLVTYPEDDRARFYLAVTRLMRDRTADAIVDLTQLVEGSSEPLRSEARWYRALARLAGGERQPALLELEEIARSAAPHAREARELLERER